MSVNQCSRQGISSREPTANMTFSKSANSRRGGAHLLTGADSDQRLAEGEGTDSTGSGEGQHEDTGRLGQPRSCTPSYPTDGARHDSIPMVSFARVRVFRAGKRFRGMLCPVG